MGFGLLNNILPFFSIYCQFSPSSHSQHLKISFSFLFPSFHGSSPSSCPFQFLGEDLFGYSILLHSLQVTKPTYPLPFYPFYNVFSFVQLFKFLICPAFPFPIFAFRTYVLLNIFLSKISRACSSFFVKVHVSALYNSTGLISVLYSLILVSLDKSLLLKRFMRQSMPCCRSQYVYVFLFLC